MSKESAAEFLDLKIEDTDGISKFVRGNGKYVTFADAVNNASASRAAVDRLSKNHSGGINDTQWEAMSILGAWIKIRDYLKESNQTASKPNRTPMPSMFDNDQFRKIMVVITSHQLFKKVDTNRDFAHTVNCITCGELGAGDDQQFHIGHMLYEAGFRKLP